MDYIEVTGNYDPSKDAAAIAAVSENTTENVTVTETANAPNDAVTGQVVSDTGSKTSFKFLIYIVGILAILVAAFFIARKFVVEGRNGFSCGGKTPCRTIGHFHSRE